MNKLGTYAFQASCQFKICTVSGYRP